MGWYIDFRWTLITILSSERARRSITKVSHPSCFPSASAELILTTSTSHLLLLIWTCAACTILWATAGISFLSTCLGQLDFEVRFRQVRPELWALFLVRMAQVEVFDVRTSERIPFYVASNGFGWGSYYGFRFLLIPMPPVFP